VLYRRANLRCTDRAREVLRVAPLGRARISRGIRIVGLRYRGMMPRWSVVVQTAGSVSRSRSSRTQTVHDSPGSTGGTRLVLGFLGLSGRFRCGGGDAGVSAAGDGLGAERPVNASNRSPQTGSSSPSEGAGGGGDDLGMAQFLDHTHYSGAHLSLPAGRNCGALRLSQIKQDASAQVTPTPAADMDTPLEMASSASRLLRI
jgi:hypothetical protein